MSELKPDPFEGQEFINVDQLTADNPNLPEGLTITKRETRNYQDKFVFEPYVDDDGNNRRYPVPMRWHLTPIVQNILRHNKTMQYTGIVEIGMSGTGKTTLTRSILHKMHMMGENYRVLWFTGHDMLNIDKIINSCQVGLPHVFVFDDASYTMESAKKEDVARLANALTTIRHHLKSRCIIFMNIHYSKATKKFFRNQHFTFLTSVTVEELGNYSDLFKEKMGVVRKFARYYNQMSLKGGFYLPVSSATYEQLYYKTNKPFRLGLVAEISDLHFFLFNKQECETCNPMRYKKIKDFSGLKDDLVKKYSTSKVRSVLQFFAMIYDNQTDGNNKKRIQYLNNDYIAIWKNLAEINRNVYVPWGAMLEELRDEIKEKKKTHKPGGVAKFRETSVINVMEQYRKELETEKSKKKKITGLDLLGPPSEEEHDVKTEDYDSTFVGSKNSRFDGDTKRR
jgi:hypothetical protein